MGLQCLFILVGWMVVCWRWVTAVMFYGRRPSRWNSHGLRVEDFWTRHILEQVDAHRTELVDGDKKKKTRSTFVSRRKKIWLPRELLPALMLLQTSVVLFSKACWLLSELLFCNTLFMRKFILNRWRGIASDPDYSKHRHLLETIALPGEKPDGIWIANRAAINKAKDLLCEGAANGKACNALIAFLRDKTSTDRVGEHCLSPGPGNRGELKFLCRVDPGEALRAERHFVFARKCSWKMTTVNLLNILVRLSVLSPGSCYSPRRSKSVQEAMKAYSEAWELMDLVDETDPEAHILSKAADKVYRNLQLEIQFRYSWSPPSSTVQSGSATSVEETIGRLAKEGKAKADCHKLGHDSMDWMEVGAGNSLYRLCKSMDCSCGDVKVVMEEVVRSVADVMDCCMERVADSLVGNCRLWARGFQEKKVAKCLYIAGKARAVMEELGRKPSKHTPSSANPNTDHYLYTDSGHYHGDRETDEDSVV